MVTMVDGHKKMVTFVVFICISRENIIYMKDRLAMTISSTWMDICFYIIPC